MMDRYHGDLSDERLISPTEDDATTINEVEIEDMPEIEASRSSMLEHCDGGRIACRGRELYEQDHTPAQPSIHRLTKTTISSQLPASAKTIYESWTITFQRPTRRLRGWTTCLGCTVGKTVALEPGRIVAVAPRPHFEQEDLAQVAACARSQHGGGGGYWAKPSWAGGKYEDELECRLRRLDGAVQGELHALLRDRSESTSNSFRRREYKLVMLLEVHGGEMTGAAGGSGRRGGKNRLWNVLRNKGTAAAARTPHVEYRVILRGSETAANDAGWGMYHRYSQPWRLADEAGLAGLREKMGYQELLG